MADTKKITKKRILVIDDNQGILFATRKALEFGGYEVFTAESFLGVEAIEKDPPDLILLDVFLGSQDGRQISRELKKNEHTRPIPIILISAYSNVDKLAEEAEADDCIAKPFSLDELFAKVKKHVGA
jgi:DNA-binding response OmpR family regulator